MKASVWVEWMNVKHTNSTSQYGRVQPKISDLKLKIF